MNAGENSKFGCLQNLKVLSAGSVLAGPFACAMFAEQGAEVIQIESTAAPDLYRKFGEGWAQEHRNQRDIALNIPSPEGKEILSHLVKWCDIMVESSKGGTWEKWGFTDEVLWGINPRLVIVHVSGFGQDGDPNYVNRGSYDPIGQAFGGYMNINGMPDPNPPMIAKQHSCDYITGLFAAWSTLAAYIRAKETGIGESVDVAQFEAMVRIQGELPLYGFNQGIEPVRWGNASSVAYNDGTYQCKDGNWVYLSMTGVAVLKRGLPMIGLGEDPDFIPTPQIVPRGNVVMGEKFVKAIRAYCAERTADEVDRLMNENMIPCSKVMNYKMMMENSHYQARQVIQEWDDPKNGKIKGIGIIPKFKKNPGEIRRGSPTYGMDNETILSDFGYSETQIKDLYQKGIIKRA